MPVVRGVSAPEATATHDRDGDRRIRTVRELVELCGGATAHDAAAADDEGPLGLLEQRDEAVHATSIGLVHVEAAHQAPGELVGKLKDAVLLHGKGRKVAARPRHVLGDVEKDRSGPAASGKDRKSVV